MTKKVLIVGPGTKFLGGVSYYTTSLSNAFSKTYKTAALTFKEQLPKFLFPGSDRVGKIKAPKFLKNIKHSQSLNWYYGSDIIKSYRFVKKFDPDIIIIQWWSSSALHVYSLLTLLNKLKWKKPIIIELHEIVDPYENSILPLKIYVKLFSRFVLNKAIHFTVHSEHDKKLMSKHFNLDKRRISVVPHGSYNHFEKQMVKRDPAVCNLLYFGLIRPYKGVEYLVKAFNKLSASEIKKYNLFILGETWEGHTKPAELIAKSKYKDRITFVNRYLTDDEIGRYFSRADAVVIPYLRASQSGAAHCAFHFGLPVISSKVGGLTEALKQYEGAILVKPKDVSGLRDAIRKIYPIRHKRYKDPHSWENTIKAYERIFNENRIC